MLTPLEPNTRFENVSKTFNNHTSTKKLPVVFFAPLMSSISSGIVRKILAMRAVRSNLSRQHFEAGDPGPRPCVFGRHGFGWFEDETTGNIEQLWRIYTYSKWILYINGYKHGGLSRVF